MYVKRIAGLARFLAEGEKSIEQVAKFLVLNTFVDLSANTLYLVEIIDDGYLAPIGSFGFDKLLVTEWGRFPLSLHVPVTQAVHLDKCVIVRGLEDLYSRYPITREVKNLHTEWDAVIAFPMQPFGAGAVTLGTQPTESEDLFEFFQTIGAILAVQFLRTSNYGGSKANGGQKKARNQKIELTERQRIIHSLMSQGFTNAQIASELGFSESLIRQETMQVFRILGVSSRKEIIESGAKF